MKQCYLEGDLKDKKVNKEDLCHLACTGSKLFKKLKILYPWVNRKNLRNISFVNLYEKSYLKIRK